MSDDAGWAEVAAAGVNFARHYDVWTASAADEQLVEVRRKLDAAQQHGMQIWLALAGVDNDLSHRPLLDAIVDAVKAHPGLGAWKGADEPAHAGIPAAGLVAVHDHVRARDPAHPLVLTEAPRLRAGRLTVAGLRPYAAACDIHGVDIYPVSVPPGRHAGGPPVNTDISVVGDVTRIVAEATPGKPIWSTQQIAWSGVLPPHPLVFPTLQQARFMAYDAIVAGARGLFFFGGHITAAMTEADRLRGWNWTYWRTVLRSVVQELSGPGHQAALAAPVAPFHVTADAPDISTSTRAAGNAIYVLAVRRSPSATGIVRFHGLPASVTEGTVLAHGPSNPARAVAVKNGVFTDSSAYRPHNARVYRFATRPS